MVMVPVVLAELLSDPKLPYDVSESLSEVPLIEIEVGYWQRRPHSAPDARPRFSSVHRFASTLVRNVAEPTFSDSKW